MLLRRLLTLKFVGRASQGVSYRKEYEIKRLIRFGTSLGVADLNKDGLKDLVVGEPYAGYHELQYEGGVTILFGSLDEGDTVELGQVMQVLVGDWRKAGRSVVWKLLVDSEPPSVRLR